MSGDVMKPVAHCCRGPHGKPGLDKMAKLMERQDRSTAFNIVGWALFFIWVGVAWLMGYGLGWILLGVGILTIAMQAARRLFRVKVEAFWLVLGAVFLVGGFWELWSAAIPLAPIFLIALGIGLLVWYCTKTLSGRKRMF